MTRDEDEHRAPASPVPPPPPDRGDSGPPTIELRIDAIEAAVAAGLVRASADPPPPADPEPEVPSAADRDLTVAFELPDWADPPTGQIPRVLLEDPDSIDINEPLLRKPTWRAQGEQWNDEEFDLSMLAPEVDAPATGEIAGTVLPEESPFGFAALDGGAAIADEDATGLDTPWEEFFDQPAPQRRRHASSRRSARLQRAATEPEPSSASDRTGGRAPSSGAPRNAFVAIGTGLALGAVVIVCLLAGPAPTDGLIAALATAAAGEFFAILQGRGFRPATIIGLLAVPACIVAAYIDGPSAIAVVVALAFVATGAWFLRRQASDEPIVDAAITIFVICWVGVLGGFAGLLLAPSAHPSKHGVALILGVIACTVAHDVGSYAVGSKFGRRKIAPRISPGKTIEGLIGGTVLDLVVALVIVSRFHPFDLGTAAGLGLIVAVVAPLGDLVESMVKRDLEVKDMGSVLPAHGGVFDRVDAMLFVMPIAYLFFRIANVA